MARPAWMDAAYSPSGSAVRRTFRRGACVKLAHFHRNSGVLYQTDDNLSFVRNLPVEHGRRLSEVLYPGETAPSAVNTDDLWPCRAGR